MRAAHQQHIDKTTLMGGAQMNQDASLYVCRALKALKGGLWPFVEDRMEMCYGGFWQEKVKVRLPKSRCLAGDTLGTLTIMKRFWGDAFAFLGKPLLADVNKALSARNLHAHDESFDRTKADDALAAIIRLLDKVAEGKEGAREFAEHVKNLRNELNAEPPQPSQTKPRTDIRPTTSRPQMSPPLKNIVREAQEKGGCEQRLFDSELQDMLNEAKEAGKQTARIVAKELCYRTIDEYVDGVMAMASEAMWTIWERQGSIPERVVYRAPSGFSNLLEIEFDTNNLPPNNDRA